VERLQDKLDQKVSRPAHSRPGYYCAIRQTPVTPDPVTDTRHPTPTTYGPRVTTLTAPTSSQAPTTTVPTDVSTSPDQSGGYDSGQGSSGDRYHPAPAPSAKRVTAAANCSPNSTFVTYIAGSQPPALAISSARQGLHAACLSAVRSTA
jgi:hypothetical protein